MAGQIAGLERGWDLTGRYCTNRESLGAVEGKRVVSVDRYYEGPELGLSWLWKVHLAALCRPA